MDNQLDKVINPEWEKLGPKADVNFVNNSDALNTINVGPEPIIDKRPDPVIPATFKGSTEDYYSIRNSILEEAAHELDMAAGEMFHNGETFHYCAKRVRELKKETNANSN